MAKPLVGCWALFLRLIYLHYKEKAILQRLNQLNVRILCGTAKWHTYGKGDRLCVIQLVKWSSGDWVKTNCLMYVSCVQNNKTHITAIANNQWKATKK